MVAPFWLRRIKSKLDAEYRERTTMDKLASEAAVHPTHLSRLFREFTGVGIGEYDTGCAFARHANECSIQSNPWLISVAI